MCWLMSYGIEAILVQFVARFFFHNGGPGWTASLFYSTFHHPPSRGCTSFQLTNGAVKNATQELTRNRWQSCPGNALAPAHGFKLKQKPVPELNRLFQLFQRANIPFTTTQNILNSGINFNSPKCFSFTEEPAGVMSGYVVIAHAK